MVQKEYFPYFCSESHRLLVIEQSLAEFSIEDAFKFHKVAEKIPQLPLNQSMSLKFHSFSIFWMRFTHMLTTLEAALWLDSLTEIWPKNILKETVSFFFFFTMHKADLSYQTGVLELKTLHNTFAIYPSPDEPGVRTSRRKVLTEDPHRPVYVTLCLL